MTDYHYVLDAPFESNKFFEKIEQDMDDNKLIFDKHRDHVVNEMISFNLKIKQYLDNLNAKFYINMNIHNINNLAGYIETLMISTGSYIDSEIMSLYIEYAVYKYLVNSIRVTNNEVKKLAENMMSTTVNKINKLISK